MPFIVYLYNLHEWNFAYALEDTGSRDYRVFRGVDFSSLMRLPGCQMIVTTIWILPNVC